MLSVAWNLRDLIEEFFDIFADTEVTNDRLSDEEWAIIRTIKDFLKKLSMSTKACESKLSTLDLTLPVTDYILQQFETEKTKCKDDTIFGPMFNSGWKKMNKYYNLFDKTPVYAAALVLHPTRKWRHIEKHWEKAWVQPAKTAVKGLWDKQYKPKAVQPTTTSSNSATTETLPSDKRAPNAFFQWLDEDEVEIEDEYTRYCSEPTIPGIKYSY